jgi:membrane protease YdiL (CAAX protease family)
VLAVFVIIQDLIVVIGALVFGVLRYRVGLDRLGLCRFDVAFGCLLSLGLFFLSFAIRICYVLTMMLLGIQLQPQEVMTRLDVTGWNFFLTFFSAAIFAPVAEEIFFRGFLYGGLRARFGSIVAIIVSTVFFTALHFSLDAFVPILVLGLFLAWLYERTGSLYPGIILHASNNALAVIALLIAQSMGVKLQ